MGFPRTGLEIIGRWPLKVPAHDNRLREMLRAIEKKMRPVRKAGMTVGDRSKENRGI